MKKTKIISVILSLVSISMVAVGVILQSDLVLQENKKMRYTEVNINNIALHAGAAIEVMKNEPVVKENNIVPATMEVTPVSVVIPPRVEVFEGMTMEELAEKLNRSLGTDYIAGKGELIAKACMEREIDPYLAVAIMLHETGCGSYCSSLARNCNNVSGQKGSPSCGGGSYKAYATLDEGIIGFLDNLKWNYYNYGLNTVEAIGSKYAEGIEWSAKINWYMEKIRNN